MQRRTDRNMHSHHQQLVLENSGGAEADTRGEHLFCSCSGKRLVQAVLTEKEHQDRTGKSS